jgi:hypothetical protein
MDIERVDIVTVSGSGARIHWRARGPAQFSASCVCTRTQAPQTARVRTCGQRYHLAEFVNLQPATQYTFQIACAGQAAACYTGHFKTLRIPAGPFRFRFATVNDIHVGEEEYGLIMLPGMGNISLTPGLRCEIQGKPFWQFTNEQAIRELNALDLDFVIVKGDLTTDPTTENMERARAMFDTLAHPYHVLRGNHDHPGAMPRDTFFDTFGADKTWYSFEHKGAGFVLLDCIHPRTGYLYFPGPELDWLQAELARLAHRPVFVFLHTPPMRVFERTPRSRVNRFMSILKAHANLAGVFYGHTHANKRVSRVCAGRRVPFVETAATMDYPGGFNIYDVHANGYMQTCLRPFDAPCCQWFEKAESAYYGLARSVLSGRIRDRNFTAPVHPHIAKNSGG